MADYFELLGQPRRPWINLELLKAAFLSLSEKLHPDRVHQSSAEAKQRAQERYSELNSAYQCLLQPRDRLQHLLELETGLKPSAIQSAPPAFMQLFLEVGELCRETDKFLEEKRMTASPLLRVTLFERGQQSSERIQALQERLRTISAAHESALRELNRAWETAPAVGDAKRTATLPLVQLEEHYRAFSYLSRWAAQLQERFVELAV